MTSHTDTSSPLIFPCRFPIKVMGLANAEFDDLVITIVRRHYPQLTPEDIERRQSGGGKYRSLTLTIVAHNRAQLDAIYLELTQSRQVMVAL